MSKKTIEEMKLSPESEKELCEEIFKSIARLVQRNIAMSVKKTDKEMIDEIKNIIDKEVERNVN